MNTKQEKQKYEKISEAIDLLKVIANEKRLMILCSLMDKELSVTELMGIVGLGQSALSQHLALMREKQFVTTRKENQTVYYSICSDEVKSIIEALHKNFCGCS